MFLCMPATPTPSSEVLAYAEALRRLRKRAGPDGRGVSQEAAATVIGQRKQTWQAYEQGHRAAIMRMDVQDRMARAIGFTREDLRKERDLVVGEAEASGQPPAPSAATSPAPAAKRPPSATPSLALPVWGRGRAGLRGAQVYDLNEPERWLDLGALYGPSCRAMQLIGDSMYPWAASGTTIVYDLDRWPRKDQGCVVETREHGYYVKLFDSVTDDRLIVRELQPEERTMEFDLQDVLGVYAVLDRIDR